jgi:ligand-binding sensor domain-containing protein
LFCFAIAAVFWRAERALRTSERDAAAGRDLAVVVRPCTGEPNPGFEAFSAPAVFRSAASFQGRFYLAGPPGLFVYANDGSLQHVFHTGLELPPAPLGQMEVSTLSNSHVPELLIATGGEGVLAFDGQHFRQIRPAEMDSRNVTALLPLGSGRLLLGTAKRGLLIFDGVTLQRFHSTTNNIYVTALAGTEADLWVGTLDAGVIHWRGGQAETISESQGLPDPRVESIALSTQGVYVGTPAGIAELRDGKFARVLARGTYAHALLVDSDAVYAGQLQGGVLRISTTAAADPLSMRRRIAMNPAEVSAMRRQGEAPIEQLLQVGDERYAVAGDQLLHLRSDGEWEKAIGGNDSLLTDRDVSSIMVAADGRIWIGYFDRGLDILSPLGGRPLHIENDQIFCVNRILENTRQGTVAVATANGLVLFDRDGRQKQVLTRDSGLIASHVTDVALFGNGMVAGTPAGITFLDATGPHSMYAFQGLVNNHVYALSAHDSTLLVGTLGGLSLISGGEVRRNLNTGNSGLKANWITAFAEAGSDWLTGTYGAGILRISADGTVSSTDATARDTIVNPGAMASNSRFVLAGTLGKGLLVGDPTGTRWRTITAGLPSLNVTATTIYNGTVYIGTDNGLVKIAEDKL